MDDKSGSEGSNSDASTSASDEEEEAGNGGSTATARKRAASNKARAAALDILQGQSCPSNLLGPFFLSYLSLFFLSWLIVLDILQSQFGCRNLFRFLFSCRFLLTCVLTLAQMSCRKMHQRSAIYE